jgi:hypothetical protein
MTLTIEDAERAAQGLDCRELEVRSDFSFLGCQIGRAGADHKGGPTFHLMAFGSSWEGALDMLAKRKR